MNSLNVAEIIKQILERNKQKSQLGYTSGDSMENLKNKIDTYGNGLKNTGDFLNKTFGNSKIGNFGSKMSNFGDSLQNANTNISDVYNAPKNLLQGSVQKFAGQGLSNIGNSLANSQNSIISGFGNNLSQIGGNLLTNGTNALSSLGLGGASASAGASAGAGALGGPIVMAIILALKALNGKNGKQALSNAQGSMKQTEQIAKDTVDTLNNSAMNEMEKNLKMSQADTSQLMDISANDISKGVQTINTTPNSNLKDSVDSFVPEYSQKGSLSNNDLMSYISNGKYADKNDIATSALYDYLLKNYGYSF